MIFFISASESLWLVYRNDFLVCNFSEFISSTVFCGFFRIFCV
jgi:hypothetical protein